MSGFFGIVRTNGTAVEPRFLEMVAQRLRFREQDGGQTWSQDGIKHYPVHGIFAALAPFFIAGVKEFSATAIR
jgi:hypothetical protein